jgi:hypothetical protein
MAKFVLKNPIITVNSVDLSDHCSSVTIETQFDEVDGTGFGATYKQLLQGLGDATITLSMFQDFVAGSVDATLWPLSQSGATFPVTVKPTSAAVGATNPRYDMTAVLLTYNPIDGQAGEMSKTDVTLRNAAQTGLTRNIV